jgi:hypothetical protein
MCGCAGVCVSVCVCVYLGVVDHRGDGHVRVGVQQGFHTGRSVAARVALMGLMTAW